LIDHFAETIGGSPPNGWMVVPKTVDKRPDDLRVS
jgi:hypothetical protein